jgi:uncharacterized protein (DUF1697 family)
MGVRMTTYIMLLRGINVGGRNALPMKELVALLEELGCQNIKTYIQSGNVVLRFAPRAASALAGKVGLAIEKRRGFRPHVLLLQIEELEHAMAANPFPEAEADPSSLHLAFLDSAPTEPDLTKLQDLRVASERFRLIDRVFYLNVPDGIGRSKLAANTERLLGVPATDRNWRTVCKLRELAKELE